MNKTGTGASQDGRLRGPRRGALACLGLLIVLGASGCVERRLAFSLSSPCSSPVTIELDGELIGTVPCEVAFVHYGEHEWVARAAGHEVTAGRVTISAPWFQYPPFDFASEALLPLTVTDRHDVAISMVPLKPRDPQALYTRAANAREQTLKELEEARRRNADRDRKLPRGEP